MNFDFIWSNLAPKEHGGEFYEVGPVSLEGVPTINCFHFCRPNLKRLEFYMAFH